MNTKSTSIIRNTETTAHAMTLSTFVAFFLAIAPILDPYALLEIGGGITLRINDVFVIALGFFCFCKKTVPTAKNSFLLLWCFLFFFMTLLGILGVDKNVSLAMAIKNIIVWVFYSLLISYLWDSVDRDKFFHFVKIIGMVAAIVVVLQFICGYLKLPMWNGRIPFFSLSEYDGWAGYIDRNTGDVRPNGIFQESSYVGIYLLVAFAQAVKENKLLLAALFALAMFMTTSMVAVLGCCVVTLYLLIGGKQMGIDTKTIRRFVFAIVFVIILIGILNTYSEAVQSAFAYIQKRFLNIGSDLEGERMGSTKWRLIGHLPLFAEYGWWQKMCGVGAAQNAAYFDLKIAYSNNFVTTLLDYGVIGLGLFIVLLMNLYRKIDKNDKVFFLIVILIFAVDRQWFNWYFLYLLTPCALSKTELKLDRNHG